MYVFVLNPFLQLKRSRGPNRGAVLTKQIRCLVYNIDKKDKDITLTINAIAQTALLQKFSAIG